ncbi:hypothetical protein [Streptomyces candidus]|uniref:Uncharacterized protein n=1 Tax=Streptomyces candidus TaxID=67283 RepID=A0A7X0HMZ4_9ACTN|nr:hypothetical protein [Streptomyces candidus]MBB6439118.1 hypothetical protein [Streptomyces candidus]GHH55717.1 hypothetical protein GCM10018773_60610 [Streptomyces candidus]
MASHDFPADLLTARQQLNQAHAELTALYRALPWSVTPTHGYTSKSRTVDPETGELRHKVFPDSPGWTEEQIGQVAALRARILELSDAVNSHPYWESVDKAHLVDARSKHLPAAAGALSGE